MVNHPNRNKTTPDGDMYRPLDAVRLMLMVQRAIAGHKAATITADQVAKTAILESYGADMESRLAASSDGGPHPHILKFAKLILMAQFDPGNEEFMKEPLPGEDALSHAARLKIEAEDLLKKASALETWGSKRP